MSFSLHFVLLCGSAAKLLDRMPQIRNDALHADWDRISEAEVGGVIGFVEQLILARLSPPSNRMNVSTPNCL